MSLHIGAKQGDIAETVLVSGDPLRARFIAENLFEEAQCYTEVRNMLGYTGYYKGRRVSVQGTGMGQPSLAIYVHELIQSYQVKNIIRIGTCGALVKELDLGDIVIAQGASTDASMNRITFNELDYAPVADFELLRKAYLKARELDISVKAGSVFSTDLFYFNNDPERWKIWIEHGILCTDMETSTLYTMAARSGVRALSILTVSDNIISGTASTSKEREQAFTDMTEIALEVV